MSAEVPTRVLDGRFSCPPFLHGNRKRAIPFAVVTLLSSFATVWGDRIGLRNSETLTFAVGEANGPEVRFAAKLAAMIGRASLKRQSGHDNNVVVTKTAQSA